MCDRISAWLLRGLTAQRAKQGTAVPSMQNCAGVSLLKRKEGEEILSRKNSLDTRSPHISCLQSAPWEGARVQSRRYALSERKAPSPRRTMAPAIIAPVIWPIPAAPAASPFGKKHSGKATQDEQPAKDGHKPRPSVRPAMRL